MVFRNGKREHKFLFTMSKHFKKKAQLTVSKSIYSSSYSLLAVKSGVTDKSTTTIQLKN